MAKAKQKKIINRDYLTPLLKKAPAAWALIRASEIRAIEKVAIISPSLDIGCGDGIVASVFLPKNQKFDWGIDMSPIEIGRAKKTNIYKNCKVDNVYQLSFKNRSFQTIFSNSVVEHLEDLDLALSEMSRVLKKSGRLIITVPTPYLTEYLGGRSILSSLGFNSLGNMYAKMFNKIFKHYNLHDHITWEKKFKKHSLKLTEHKYYHSKRLVRIHELLTYLALPQQISKIFFNNWVISKTLRNIVILPFLLPVIRNIYKNDESSGEGGSLMLVAEKIN